MSNIQQTAQPPSGLHKASTTTLTSPSSVAKPGVQFNVSSLFSYAHYPFDMLQFTHDAISQLQGKLLSKETGCSIHGLTCRLRITLQSVSRFN